VVKLGRRAAPEPSPPKEEEEPGDVFDQQGTGSAALLRDLHTALLAAAQGSLAAAAGEAPAAAPEKAVLYSVEAPPGPIVWPEDVGVHLLNAPLGEGSVPYAAHVSVGHYLGHHSRIAAALCFKRPTRGAGHFGSGSKAAHSLADRFEII